MASSWRRHPGRGRPRGGFIDPPGPGLCQKAITIAGEPSTSTQGVRRRTCVQGASSNVYEQTPEQRIAQLEQELTSTRDELRQTKSALERVREQYRHALEQLQLIYRRLFVAKAERRDTSAEQLAFDKLLDEVQALEKVLDAAEGADADAATPDAPEQAQPKTDGRKKRSTPPTGRRDLSKSGLPNRTGRNPRSRARGQGRADRSRGGPPARPPARRPEAHHPRADRLQGGGRRAGRSRRPGGRRPRSRSHNRGLLPRRHFRNVYGRRRGDGDEPGRQEVSHRRRAAAG